MASRPVELGVQRLLTRASIRGVLRAASVSLVLLAVLIGSALITTTSYVRESAEDQLTDQRAFDTLDDIRTQLEQHRRVVQSDLAHGATRPSEDAREIESRLRRDLQVVNESLEVGEGEWHQEEVRRALGVYLAGVEKQYLEFPPTVSPDVLRPELRQALYAVNNLMSLLRVQATLEQTRFNRLELLADVGGLALAVSLVVLAGLLIVWFALAVKQPLDSLQSAVDHFDSREALKFDAPAPPELERLGRSLEELSARLVRQRSNQLTFLAAVAHDLRTPLTSLRYSAARLTRNASQADPEQVEETAARVQRQVASMERMIGDLLDATRIEAGELELRKERHDLRVLVRDAIRTFEEVTSNFPLEVRLSEGPVEAVVDPLRIEQVLHNLLSNAIKYSPMGGPIRVCVSSDGAFARFDVEDHGIGIAPEQIEAVFEPFRRPGSLKNVVPGVGLGLSVCRRIVEAHGGTIWVESRLGVGSKFCVRVPVAPTHHADAGGSHPTQC